MSRLVLISLDILFLVVTGCIAFLFETKHKKKTKSSLAFRISFIHVMISCVTSLLLLHTNILIHNHVVALVLSLIYFYIVSALPLMFFRLSIISSNLNFCLDSLLTRIIIHCPLLLYVVYSTVRVVQNLQTEIIFDHNLLKQLFTHDISLGYLFLFVTYVGILLFFAYKYRDSDSREYWNIMPCYVMFSLFVMIFNIGSKVNISYHYVFSVFLYAIYMSNFNKKAIYINNKIHNEYNYAHFLNKINNNLSKNKRFIIIAAAIDHFDELKKTYGESTIVNLIQRITEFLGRIFPTNEIYHYDNFNFIFVFDNEKRQILSLGNIIDDINSVFNMPWEIGNSRENITVTISSLFCPEDSRNITEIIDMLRNSIAAAQSKGNGAIVYGRDHLHNIEKTLSDLTYEKKKLELATKEAINNRTALEIADKEKTVFLANISHEIRTHLSSIIGLNESIVKERISPNIRNMCEDIRQSSNSLLTVFNNMLDFFNIDCGKFFIVESTYNINEIATQALNIVSSQIKNKNLNVEYSIEKNFPSQLSGDVQRIRQIIINLLSNAISNTSEGTVKLEIRFHTKGNATLDLTISVIDNGPTLSETDINNIFNNVPNIDTRKNSQTENNVFNLSICKRIIELMNGNIVVKNSPTGHGNIFTINIPQNIISFASIEDSDTNYKTKVFTETFTAKGANILVVDDNRLNREITKGLLKPYEINVTTAVSGEECLKLMKKNIYDLVFMDYLMPVMNGIDTFEQIRKMEGTYFKEVPIVLLTANVTNENRNFFLEKGFADYISKPIDISLLDTVLKKTLPAELIVEKKEIIYDNSKPYGGVFPDIKGIDKQTALANFNNNLDDLLVELNRFATNAPNILSELENTIIHNDYSKYLMYLTNLTEQAKKLGITKLSKMGYSHEKAAHEQNTEFIQKNLPFLVQAYKKIIEELNSTYSKRE